MTGRPQAVLLHAGVGLLQGSMGIHGALQAEVPMIVMSGESQSLGAVSVIGRVAPPAPRRQAISVLSRDTEVLRGLPSAAANT